MPCLQEELFVSIQKIYQKCGLVCDDFIPESESKDYLAGSYFVNELKVQLRKSKITPTKIGQFVTLWKRSKGRGIAPYDTKDKIDFFIIQVEKDNYLGQFIFPKSILLEKNIFSCNGFGGKLGIRVYPSWDSPISKQAQKTQAWQLKYFIETKSLNFCNYIKLLYEI